MILYHTTKPMSVQLLILILDMVYKLNIINISIRFTIYNKKEGMSNVNKKAKTKCMPLCQNINYNCRTKNYIKSLYSIICPLLIG